MDRLFLAGSTLCFLLAFGITLFSRGTRLRRTSRINLGVIGAGFALQTAFLWARGQSLGRCPLTTLAEVLVFLSWGMVLFYLLIGNTYRLSPLGIFTAPLAGGLQALALLGPIDHASLAPPRTHPAVNGWLEFHAAFSVLAYGAFALASVAAGMYLLQERQLKTHRLGSTFFQMPPIAELGLVNGRLVTVGFVLLSLGLVAGVNMGTPNTWTHLSGAIVTWVFYAFLTLAQWGAWRLAPRQVARLSIAGFSVALFTLMGFSFSGTSGGVGGPVRS